MREKKQWREFRPMHALVNVTDWTFAAYRTIANSERAKIVRVLHGENAPCVKVTPHQSVLYVFFFFNKTNAVRRSSHDDEIQITRQGRKSKATHQLRLRTTCGLIKSQRWLPHLDTHIHMAVHFYIFRLHYDFISLFVWYFNAAFDLPLTENVPCKLSGTFAWTFFLSLVFYIF